MNIYSITISVESAGEQHVEVEDFVLLQGYKALEIGICFGLSNGA